MNMYIFIYYLGFVASLLGFGLAIYTSNDFVLFIYSVCAAMSGILLMIIVRLIELEKKIKVRK